MRNVYLTGFSGSGKTTVARLLGARLGLRPRDLDEEIVARAGAPIAEIFAREGEAAFRRREAAALRAVATERGQVVATGGGIVVAEENRELMAASGWVVCLEALPETLHERLRGEWHPGSTGRPVRPLLDAPDPLARIRSLKDARQAAYARAHWTVHTDSLTPEQVAGEVARTVAMLEGRAERGTSDGVGTAGAAPLVHVPRSALRAPRSYGGFRLGPKWFGRDRPLLCVPVVAETRAAALDRARECAAVAPDAIELRADHLADRDAAPERLPDFLAELARLGVPVIFTNRAGREGGARPQDEGARLALIEAAIESGLPALIDLELSTAPPDRDRLLAAARRRGVPVMLSFHDFAATPEDAVLLDRLRAIEAAGADAAKLAVMPRDDEDALRLLAVCRRATAGESALPVAAMAMGPLGVVTRVTGHLAGSALTFAALAAGTGSAPGQLTVEQLRRYWTLLNAE